ncbi:MAG TPA: chorismate mutase [Mesorhizobium sp.]|jgi:chorismate mutase|nr:chorismate mutase [Mesorhizobium sp.]
MSAASADPKAVLTDLRASIDNIDAALVHILAERFRRTQAVGRLKAEHGLPPADPSREKQQIARLRRLAEEAQLDPDFAEKFLNFIIREVIRHHEAFRAGAMAPDGLGGEARPPAIAASAILGSQDDLPEQMG